MKIYTCVSLNMLEEFDKYNTEKSLFRAKDKILVAVSGGIDSVVLCDVLYKKKYTFDVAHCNFGLRGEESDGDESFVRELCQKWGVKLFVKHFDTKSYSAEKKISIQMAARELRYAWFEEIRKQEGYDYIATAHHANDVLETMFLNLIKGTGISGLHGIRARIGSVIRPLLFATKEDIITYAIANGLQWREDSSNLENKYQRNLIRNQIIPWIKKINANIEQTISTTAEKISAEENLLEQKVGEIKQEILYTEEEHWYIDSDKLLQQAEPVYLLFRLLLPFGFNYHQAKDMVNTHHTSGTCYYSASHLLIIDRNRFIVKERKEDSCAVFIMQEEFKEVRSEHFVINACVSTIDDKFELIRKKEVAMLDRDKLNFPLILRPWKKGDYFYPLGMKGKKKISDFLIDLRMPLSEKNSVYVLESGGDIAWVVGLRIDERFKISDSTKTCYMLKWKKNSSIAKSVYEV
ncbi:MAG: tRNA lysidine(34) synthetase TilS [Cytophagaceae bacterium]|nr:tRNA lysidine(34) synthetase TilS [Cytophagaceae bacterium]MDW8456812.1 tRNA lysidine(34) synthetase TilS [Cytophagaceae bacterium]